MIWLLILILIAMAAAFFWYKVPPPKASHGDWTVPPVPKPFTPIEDEFLRNQPPLEKLVDDRLIERLPPLPSPKGKPKKTNHHAKRGKK